MFAPQPGGGNVELARTPALPTGVPTGVPVASTGAQTVVVNSRDAASETAADPPPAYPAYPACPGADAPPSYPACTYSPTYPADASADPPPAYPAYPACQGADAGPVYTACAGPLPVGTVVVLAPPPV